MKGKSTANEAVGAGLRGPDEKGLGEVAGEGCARERTIAATPRPQPGGNAQTEFEEGLAHQRREARRSASKPMSLVLRLHDQGKMITLAPVSPGIDCEPWRHRVEGLAGRKVVG